MSASIKKKVSQNRTKYCNKQNKQTKQTKQTNKQTKQTNKTNKQNKQTKQTNKTNKQNKQNKQNKTEQNKQTNKTNKQNKQTTIFSAKNKQSISGPYFTKSEGKVRFGQLFFENDPLDEPKKMPSNKKFYLFRKKVKNAKW